MAKFAGAAKVIVLCAGTVTVIALWRLWPGGAPSPGPDAGPPAAAPAWQMAAQPHRSSAAPIDENKAAAPRIERGVRPSRGPRLPQSSGEPMAAAPPPLDFEAIEKPAASAPDSGRSPHLLPGYAPRPSKQGPQSSGHQPPPAAPGQPPNVAAADPSDRQEFEDLRTTIQKDPDPTARAGAIESLSTDYPAQDAIPILQQALSDPDPDVRIAALQALADVTDDNPPIDILERALDDPDPDVRVAVLDIADSMDNGSGQTLVQQALHDSNEDVRDKATLLSDLPD